MSPKAPSSINFALLLDTGSCYLFLCGHTDQAGTQLTGVHLPLPASQVLRLKAGATMPVSFLQNLTVIYDLHGV